MIRTITPIGTAILHHEVGAGIWDTPKARAGSTVPDLRVLYAGPSRYLAQRGDPNGTDRGRPVSFTGGFDRMHGRGAVDFLTKKPFIYLAYSEVDADGRRKDGAAFVLGEKSAGMYYKDGEDPVVSKQIEPEAQYVQNPHNAAQVVPAWTTYRFGGKELTFVARHQSVGARLGRLRILDQWGLWRERHSPAKFVRSLGTVESHIPAGSVRITPTDQLSFPKNSPLR